MIALFIGSKSGSGIAKKLKIRLQIWIQGWIHNTSIGIMIPHFTWSGTGIKIAKNLKTWLRILVQGWSNNTSNSHPFLPHSYHYLKKKSSCNRFITRHIKYTGRTDSPKIPSTISKKVASNWPWRLLLWKCHVLQCISGLAGRILYNPGSEIFLYTCLTIAYSMAESITRSLGAQNWPQSRPPPPKTAVLLYLVV